jgi:excisionase family DNA binding protein
VQGRLEIDKENHLQMEMSLFMALVATELTTKSAPKASRELDTCSVPTLLANEYPAERAALPPKARLVPDACAALGGISRATLYKLATQGKIRFIKIGGRTLVPESEIDRLAREGTA